MYIHMMVNCDARVGRLRKKIIIMHQ